MHTLSFPNSKFHTGYMVPEYFSKKKIMVVIFIHDCLIAFIYKMYNLGKCMRELSFYKQKDPVKTLDLLHWENIVIHNKVIMIWSKINIFP